ncbi:DUF3761 domain-containing protein [Streptomyces sp. NPDC020298]|uniref:DUF3761 domain-containing protein n=1 Tax=unclassified Streptomyces TaxID=2593676 RepID=UPI0033D3959F
MRRTFIAAAATLFLAGVTGCSSNSTPTSDDKPAAASPSKPAAASPSKAHAGDPVPYLYDVDDHRYSRAKVEGLVQRIGSRCTDDVLGLEYSATSTALDLVDTEHHQDVYRVLDELVTGLPDSDGKTWCAPLLSDVGKRIKAQRVASESPTATASPTHRATPKAAVRPPAPAPATHHTTAPPVDDHGGATALCNDGTLSYSAHHQGTCSHHHGVAQWYQ